MNRFNTGNVITNGMQILSVGATTASRVLGDATSPLNNLSHDEKKQIGEMRANQMRDELNEYNTGGKSATQHLTSEEMTDYRKKQADDIRKYTYGDNDYDEGIASIDDIMSDNSEQVNATKTKVENDFTWFKEWKERSLGNRNILTRKSIEEFDKKIGGNENADV